MLNDVVNSLKGGHFMKLVDNTSRKCYTYKTYDNVRWHKMKGLIMMQVVGTTSKL